jgi:hypothetical protein
VANTYMSEILLRRSRAAIYSRNYLLAVTIHPRGRAGSGYLSRFLTYPTRLTKATSRDKSRIPQVPKPQPRTDFRTYKTQGDIPP